LQCVHSFSDNAGVTKTLSRYATDLFISHNTGWLLQSKDIRLTRVESSPGVVQQVQTGTDDSKTYLLHFRRTGWKLNIDTAQSFSWLLQNRAEIYFGL